MNRKPVAVLTEEQVFEILTLTKAGARQAHLAERYKVSPKTIQRIQKGDTWPEVYQKFELQSHHAPPTLPYIPVVVYDPGILDEFDRLVSIKNHYGLSFRQPIYWGWFEDWEGAHPCASDGFIIWEDKDLNQYAQELHTLGHAGYPFWSNVTDELPTHELEVMMTREIRHPLRLGIDYGGIVRLQDHYKNYYYIDQKYYLIAQRMELAMHSIKGIGQFIYFTQTKIRPGDDPYTIPIACVATVLCE